MIIELEKEKLDLLDSSFIDKEYIEKELSSNPYAKILLYIEKKEIVGYLYYSDIYERAEINQIEVENSHRNCGLGTKLMDYFTKTVDKDITLEVREDNISALKLYKKFGFNKTAIRKGYYKGVDGILMERKIHK
ncbi:MAG: GNAT family N-acetyltransferase [Bacilli bacterium]|nr:GNAT family N-acetyltransferase [Bacilli bacterium]